jgi:hypothetical protein
VLAGTITHCLLSVSARSRSSASDTEGFSGNPAVGNTGAVGGKACSEVTGSSDNGDMKPFSISFARDAGSAIGSSILLVLVNRMRAQAYL